MQSKQLKNKDKTKADFDILRIKAEELLLHETPLLSGHYPEADTLKLFHELSVQQVELELQNIELNQAISDAQEAIELYDFAPTGFFTLTPSGAISRLNLRGSWLLGRERSQLINIQFNHFLTSETKPVFHNFLSKVFESGTKNTCEVTLSVEGKLMIINLTGIVASEKSQCLVTSLDITDTKLQEKINIARLHLLQFADSHTLDELLEETLNQAEILTGSLIGFYHFVDADQQTLHLQNWSTRTKKEFCRAEGKGTHYDISLAGVWTDCIREGKAVIHNDYSSLPHKKGLPEGHAQIFREMVIPVYRNGKVMAIIGVGNKPSEYTNKDIESASLLADLAWDITGRKKAEEEILQKNEALVKINAEKDKFFSIIAHDLRGPFNGFLGLTQIMAESLPSRSMDDLQKIAVSLRKSATNLYSLLGNLLEWSQLQRGLTPFNPESILVKPRVLEIMGQVSEFIQKKEIVVSIEIPENLIVFADTNMLAGILRNILNNAIKFTPMNGNIAVTAFINGDNFVEFSIEDTGIGMDKIILDNLFNHDINTNRKGTDGEPSTGLGLLICKDLIEKHQGKLWIESEVGKGSKIHFSLPGNS